MRWPLARYTLIFCLGAVLGTAYDWIHVVFGVLKYEHPHFAGTSYWVALEFGFSGMAGALIVRKLSRRVAPPRVGWRRTIFDHVWLLIAYLVTGIFVGNNALTFAVLLPMALVAVATRFSAFIGASALFAAVSGPLAEIVTSGPLGLFHYTVAHPVPYWLPLLWVIASGAFADSAILIFGVPYRPMLAHRLERHLISYFHK